jgi:aldose sugar dehydrogenase
VVYVWSLSANSDQVFAGEGEGGEENKDETLPTIVNNLNLKVEVVSSGLDTPTSMAFLGLDDILILEKDKGSVRRILNGNMLDEPLLQVDVAEKRKGRLGEMGLLGIAVSNSSNKEPSIFLYYTEAKGSTALVSNRLYKYELINNKLENAELLLNLPGSPPVVMTNHTSSDDDSYENNIEAFRLGTDHNGGVVVIGPDNNLYVVIGDVGGHNTLDQNVKGSSSTKATSSILRITQDGQLVNGKGILGDEHPLDMYYAYGIRSSFGMDFDPVTGRLWDTENGPDYGDEINLIEPGFNSGWLVVQGIWKPNAESLTPDGHTAGELVLDPSDNLVTFGGKGQYSRPEFIWKDTVGPTALKFLDSDKYGKEYQNDMFVGDWNNGYLYHFELNQNRTELVLHGLLADKVAHNPNEINKSEIIFGKGFGGITDIEVGPDGYLYLVSIGYGKIFRIVPTSN